MIITTNLTLSQREVRPLSPLLRKQLWLTILEAKTTATTTLLKKTTVMNLLLLILNEDVQIFHLKILEKVGFLVCPDKSNYDIICYTTINNTDTK